MNLETSMNIERSSGSESPRASLGASSVSKKRPPSVNKKYYDSHTEYYKKYYQDRKDKWNDYSPKECECGLVVNSLWSHKKSKKHKDIMLIVERAKPTNH